jgi:hypothetical protein
MLYGKVAAARVKMEIRAVTGFAGTAELVIMVGLPGPVALTLDRSKPCCTVYLYSIQ